MIVVARHLVQHLGVCHIRRVEQSLEFLKIGLHLGEAFIRYVYGSPVCGGALYDAAGVDQLEDVFAEHVCDKCAAPGVCAQETLHIERPNGVFDWGCTDVERRAEFTLRYFFSRAQFAGDYAAAENIRDLVADRQ